MAPVMEPEEGPGREIGQGYVYVTLGLTFAGGIILFMLAGFGLDRWLGLTPFLTVTGTLVGAVLSFLHVYWRLQADTEKRQRERQARKGIGR